ncbi:hypothetical protein CWI81_02005 [Idiomarina seosinensis]|uniref:RcsF protein n=1 Tax=Idiomarina seosinensis TaxID=281739 RepID=A0A432ZHA4_9GAMM|nr:hypothetical protein CWI81_02005 [Idiomarina seosinensis]
MLRKSFVSSVKVLSFVTALLTLAGCSQFQWQNPFALVAPVNQPTESKSSASDPNDIDVLTNADSRNYRLLSIVTGDSCQLRLDQPPASQQQAIQSMRIDAARFGAQAIIENHCYQLPSTRHSSCYTQVSCFGKAVSRVSNN